MSGIVGRGLRAERGCSRPWVVGAHVMAFYEGAVTGRVREHGPLRVVHTGYQVEETDECAGRKLPRNMSGS